MVSRGQDHPDQSGLLPGGARAHRRAGHADRLSMPAGVGGPARGQREV